MTIQKGKALLSKITIKGVYGDIEKPMVETAIMRVYGQATGYKVATSQYGDSLGFTGIFKAVNAATGEMFNAGKCYLPKIIESQLGGILDGANQGAEFAFDISVVPADNAFGYEYRVHSVIEAVEAPVITALEQKMGMLALPDHDKKAPEPAKAGKGKGR